MQLIVFEDAGYRNLLPLVYTRATFDLRCGLDCLLDKIEQAAGITAEALFVRDALAPVMAERQTRRVNQPPTADDQLWINGRLLLRQKPNLPPESAAWRGETLLAARLPCRLGCRLTAEVLQDPDKLKAALADTRAVELPPDAALLVDYPWQLVHENGAEIVRQFADRAAGIDGEVYPGASLLNDSAICIGAGTRVKPTAVLDAESGPISIGSNVIIHPHVSIQGPCSIGDGCIVQPGASIRGGTSIGPFCKVGGEIEGTIFQGYANKQHDGFLGHAYVGEWVNLGADTVNSDLKNTYGSVRVPVNGKRVDTGHMFVGAFLGDHTKTGINVALPTGCVVGFAANVFVSRHAPKFVPSFSWLTDEGMEANDPGRALAVARKVVARRDRKLSKAEEKLFLAVAELARETESEP